MDLIVAVVNSFFLKTEIQIVDYPKVNPEELSFQTLLIFSKKGDVTIAKYFGYREPVSNDYFIISDRHFTNGVRFGIVYQVQINKDGKLFLQGIKEKITLEKIRAK